MLNPMAFHIRQLASPTHLPETFIVGHYNIIYLKYNRWDVAKISKGRLGIFQKYSFLQDSISQELIAILRVLPGTWILGLFMD